METEKWTRSSKCESNQCLEVRYEEDDLGPRFIIRESDAPDLQVSYSPEQWDLFLAWALSGLVNPDLYGQKTGLIVKAEDWHQFQAGILAGDFEPMKLRKAWFDSHL